MADNEIAAYLAEHPRMIGVLFTMMLLLTQAGNVAAGNNVTVIGP
jgi:hypothetical protein